MPFTPKSWQDLPSTATPINAAALVDLETRLSAYSASVPGTSVGVSVVTNSPYNAKCDAQAVADGVMAGSSHTLTSVSGKFASGDVGKNVLVTSAGASTTAPLLTTVSAYVSATQVTLSAACNSTGVSAATVFWGSDDTVAVQSALNAGGVVKVPSGSGCLVSSLAPTNNTLFDIQGATVYQYQAANQSTVYQSLTGGDPAAVDGFTVLGGVFQGHGEEQSNQFAVGIVNVADVKILYTRMLGLAANSLYLADVHRCQVLNTTTITGVNTNGRNQIDIVYGGAGSAGNVPTDVLIEGNYVSTPGAGVAGICVTATTNTSGTYPPTIPGRINIANNDVTNYGFGSIALELGGTTVNGNIHEVSIHDNICTQLGTAGGVYGIQVTDDSSTPSTDPTVLQDILIQGNTINSGQHGIQSQASRCLIADNNVTAAGQAVLCQSHGGVNITHNLVRDNEIHLLDGASYGVWLSGCDDSSTADNDIFWDTGASGTAGIYAQTCNRLKLSDDRVRFAPAWGARISGGSDITIDGLDVRDPGSAGGANGSAVRLDGTITGDNTIRLVAKDDRGGSAKMTYAIEQLATGGQYYARGCTGIGWITAATTGTFTVNRSNVWDETGVVYNEGTRETYGTAAPSSGTWSAGDICWNTSPATGVDHWRCTVAGSPGTWQQVTLGPQPIVRGSSSGVQAINLGNVLDTYVTITATGAFSWTFSNAQAGATVTIRVQQDATGGRVSTWPTGTKWAGGTPPTQSSTGNAVDLYTFLVTAVSGGVPSELLGHQAGAGYA